MQTTWLLICNASKAFIYDITHYQPYNKKQWAHTKPTLVCEMTHPKSRAHPSDIVSDKPGHYQTDRVGQGFFAPPHDDQEVEFEKFAQEISYTLDKARTRQKYDELVVCAEPRFYGILNHHLSGVTQKAVKKVFQKNYIPFPQAKLHQAIAEVAHATLAPEWA